jgi:hypothetical protein
MGKFSRRVGLGVAVIAAALASVPAAAPAAVLGQTFVAPGLCSSGFDAVQVGSAGPSYTVPSSGRITSWSTGPAGVTGTTMRVEMWRPVGALGATGTFSLVGISSGQTLAANSVNTFNLSQPISVRAGDRLGFRVGGTVGSGCATFTNNPADNTYTVINGGPPGVGGSEQMVQTPRWQMNVSAVFQSGGAPVQIGRPPAAGPSSDPEAWVGSPFDGYWASSDGCPNPFPSYQCSEPQYHSVDYFASDQTPRTQSWATDLGGPNVTPGTPVYLYVAPQLSGTAITTKVDRVGPACSAPNSAGSVVVIGVYSGTIKIGTIAYAHVTPLVAQGATIDRWGTEIATVGGGYARSKCWSGTHLHFEMGNTRNYSCFNGGLSFGSPWGQAIYRTNFVGFLGGARTSGSRQACP